MVDMFANGQWRVTDYGIESVHPPAPEYFIEASRLMELGWPEHMAEKTWVDVDAFIEAYDKALDLHSGNYGGSVSEERRAALYRAARRHAGISREIPRNPVKA